jgi:four helix bundle protein
MRDHTSLLAWQLSRAVTRSALSVCRDHWTPWASALFAQLQRASLSVQLNIAEGYARRYRREFLHHLNIAYGSAVETGELLGLCADENVLPNELLQPMQRDCARCQRLLLGLIRGLGVR